jgi:hypothetical protein
MTLGAAPKNLWPICGQNSQHIAVRRWQRMGKDLFNAWTDEQVNSVPPDILSCNPHTLSSGLYKSN